jgi:hypothetical protein
MPVPITLSNPNVAAQNPLEQAVWRGLTRKRYGGSTDTIETRMSMYAVSASERRAVKDRTDVHHHACVGRTVLA